MNEELMEQRLKRAERRISGLMAVMVFLGGALLIAMSNAEGDPDVLTVRGLVVVDEDDRERVVLGAPMDGVSSDERLEGTVGAAVVDSTAHFNVIVGKNSPVILGDGTVGTRIADNAGITFYDIEDGSERGGLGTLADGTATVCLDYGGGGEAACMFTSERFGYTGIMLNAPSEGEDGQRLLAGLSLENEGDGFLILNDDEGNRVMRLPDDIQR